MCGWIRTSNKCLSIRVLSHHIFVWGCIWCKYRSTEANTKDNMKLVFRGPAPRNKEQLAYFYQFGKLFCNSNNILYWYFYLRFVLSTYSLRKIDRRGKDGLYCTTFTNNIQLPFVPYILLHASEEMSSSIEVAMYTSSGHIEM